MHSTLLITELSNQDAREALFTCVVLFACEKNARREPRLQASSSSISRIRILCIRSETKSIAFQDCRTNLYFSLHSASFATDAKVNVIRQDNFLNVSARAHEAQLLFVPFRLKRVKSLPTHTNNDAFSKLSVLNSLNCGNRLRKSVLISVF